MLALPASCFGHYFQLEGIKRQQGAEERVGAQSQKVPVLVPAPLLTSCGARPGHTLAWGLTSLTWARSLGEMISKARLSVILWSSMAM